METQFSVSRLSSTARNSLLSPHSHGVHASFRSDTCTTHIGMATGLDVQPRLAHTYDSPLVQRT